MESNSSASKPPPKPPRRPREETVERTPPPPAAAEAPPTPPPPPLKTREQAGVEFRAGLKAFFRKHNPDKLENVPIVLESYRGEEVALVQDLHKKYEIAIDSAAAKKFFNQASAMQVYTREDIEYAREREESRKNVEEEARPSVPALPPQPSQPSQPPPPPPKKAPPPPPAAAPQQGSEQDAEQEGEEEAPRESLPAYAPPPPPKPPKPPRTNSGKDNTNEALGRKQEDDGVDEDEKEDEEDIFDGESEAYKRRAVHSFRGKRGESSNIKKGELVKVRAKDGSEERHYFILKSDALDYIKDHSGNYGKRAKHDMALLVSNMTGMSLGTDHMEKDLTRSIDLNEVLVLPLPEQGEVNGSGKEVKTNTSTSDEQPAENSGRIGSITSTTTVLANVPDDGRTFRLFTRQKSFFLRAVDRASRDAWMSAIKAAAEKVQWVKRGKLLELSEVAPIRVIASTQDCCMVCKKEFRGMLGILNSRHHHCRACGAVVCDACSRERARIPSLDERALFKCCIICAKELKGARKYGARRRSIL